MPKVATEYLVSTWDVITGGEGQHIKSCGILVCPTLLLVEKSRPQRVLLRNVSHTA
jgi:hypothetical protein